MNKHQSPLNVATLHLKGRDALLDEVVGRLQLQVTSRFAAGEPRRRGGFHVESGLSASIADGSTPEAMMKQVRRFIEKHKKQDPKVFPDAVDAEIAVGISVGDSIQFAATVRLLPADIVGLAAIGIAFSFAAYPTSDGENG